MKLDKQQINAVASKVLNEIQIANYKKANSVENIKIIEEFKKKHEKLNKQYNVLHEEIIELSKILTKKLNIEYVYGLSHVTKTEVIINSIKNVIPNIEAIKQEIILSSITEDPQDLESMIAKLVSKFSKYYLIKHILKSYRLISIGFFILKLKI